MVPKIGKRKRKLGNIMLNLTYKSKELKKDEEKAVLSREGAIEPNIKLVDKFV